MKIIKKVFIASAITMSAFALAPKIMPNMQNAYTVQAANVKISNTKKTMYKGYTYKLSVKGTKKQVKWTSSDKSKATVSSNGKVYAKKNGKVTITAKVDGKNYNCKVSIKNKPYNFVQFKNTTFYDLKDIAQDYRKIEDIKNYKDFYIDLDGDGNTDKITIKNSGKDELGYNMHSILLNGKEFKELEDTWTTFVYIADLNKNDNKKEIVIEEPGVGDSKVYTIYFKNNNKMKLAGSFSKLYISNTLKVNQKGKLLLSDYIMERISPKIYSEYYLYNGNKIIVKNLNAKNIKNVKFSINKATLFTKDLKNLDKYSEYRSADMKYEEALKKANIDKKIYKNFKIIKFENTENNIIYVQLENGKKGYLLTESGNIFG